MTYRFDPEGIFDEEVRRIAREQLEKAIFALTDRPDGLHEGIHEARKHFKRVRALYRLIARQEPGFQKRENRRLRDVARSLSTFRDATALIESAVHLNKKAETDEERAVLGRLIEALQARRDWLDRAETDLEGKTETAVEISRDALAALDAAEFSAGRKAVGRLLRKSWQKTGRKAIAAVEACRTIGHDDNFHELRKSGQDCWMQHALLREIWPSAMQAKQKQAKDMVDILGRHHDLSVLSEVLAAEPELVIHEGDIQILHRVIVQEKYIERHKSLSLAKSVFFEPPKREAERIEKLWLIASG